MNASQDREDFCAENLSPPFDVEAGSISEQMARFGRGGGGGGGGLVCNLLYLTCYTEA